MTEKRYIRTIIGQIYDCKDDKWVTEDWDRLTLEEDDEVVELLNEQDETIQELERELNKIGMNHAEDIGFKFAVKEVLQRHYKYAENQRQKNLDDVKIASIYNLLRSTIRDIADELEIDLTPSDYDEFWNTKIKHLKVDLE